MITSRQNQRLKDMRRLRRCKGDGALLEGPTLVAEALEAGITLDSVLVTPEFLASPAGRDLAVALPREALEVAPGVLASLADADSPRGVVAAARLPRAGVRALPVVREGVYLFVEGLQDPGNLGALARVAEAAGAVGLALAPGSVHPNHPRALRASAGSLLRLPTAHRVEPEELAGHLESLDPEWIALEPRGGEALYEASLDGALVLALGAEGPGLSPTLASRCGRRLTVPLAAPVESLNATVAAALVLFERCRRLGGPPLRDRRRSPGP